MTNDLSDLLNALNKVQSELKPVEKTKLNPHFRSKFADLSGVLDEVLPLLAKNGLVLIQSISGSETHPVLDTIIAHAKSGQNIKSTAPLLCKEMTPQSLGSAITYMRRYSLMAIVGVSTVDEDDDGQRASKPVVQQQKPQQPQKPIVTQAFNDKMKQGPQIKPSIPLTQKLVNHAPGAKNNPPQDMAPFPVDDDIPF